jgi:hypothetical protein
MAAANAAEKNAADYPLFVNTISKHRRSALYDIFYKTQNRQNKLHLAGDFRERRDGYVFACSHTPKKLYNRIVCIVR